MQADNAAQGFEEGEPETIFERDDPERAERVREIAEEHGFPLSDWQPTIPDPPAASVDPLAEKWHVSETSDDYPVVYVARVLGNGEPYAHVLFQGDWGELPHAEHIAKLHNEWLEARNGNA